MYSKDSLKKFKYQADAMAAKLTDADIIKLGTCITQGNRKIGRVLNVSLLPIRDCGNCSHCSPYCYDIKANLQYPNTVLPARVRNSLLARNHRAQYFADIRNKCARRRKNKYFRWHVSGDILDADYFAEMVSIAREFPEFTFWTYTKMFGIVNDWISANGALPVNLHVMFSVWDGMPTPNPFGLPVFACRLKDGNKDITDTEFSKMFKCPNNCDICKASCRGCVVGESAYADEH